MNRRYIVAATTLALVGLLSTTRSADAQKMFKWTDKDGKVHFSNVAPPGEQAEEASGVTGVEASGSSGAAAGAPAPQAPNEVSPGAAAAGVQALGAAGAPAQSASSAVSDELFSSQATATRLKLKREIVQAKEDARVAAAKKNQDLAQKPGLEMLQQAFDPNHQHDSKDLDELQKRKEKADGKVEDIRKQYAALRDEAT